MTASHFHSTMRAHSWFRLTLCGLAMLACGFVSIDAQTGGGERTLYVSAVTAKGEPVDDLSAGAFVVREDGTRREVLRVAPATEPIDIALLVDNSTAADRLIPRLREALPAFVAALTPANNMAVITLASRPTIAIDYTNNTTQLTESVSRLFALPQTGMTLLDAITETAEGLTKRSASRAALVAIVTDGPEFTNRYARDVVDTLETVGASLYLVTIGQFDISSERDVRQRLQLLDAGPQATGGRRIHLFTPISVKSALDSLAAELSSQYKVVYSRPASLIPPENVEISSAREGVTMRGIPARTP